MSTRREQGTGQGNRCRRGGPVSRTHTTRRVTTVTRSRGRFLVRESLAVQRNLANMSHASTVAPLVRSFTARQRPTTTARNAPLPRDDCLPPGFAAARRARTHARTHEICAHGVIAWNGTTESELSARIRHLRSLGSTRIRVKSGAGTRRRRSGRSRTSRRSPSTSLGRARLRRVAVLSTRHTKWVRALHCPA